MSAPGIRLIKAGNKPARLSGAEIQALTADRVARLLATRKEESEAREAELRAWRAAGAAKARSTARAHRLVAVLLVLGTLQAFTSHGLVWVGLFSGLLLFVWGAYLVVGEIPFARRREPRS